MESHAWAIALVLAAASLLCAGCTAPAESGASDDAARLEMLSLLGGMQGAVTGNLTAIDRAAAETAAGLGSTGLSGPQAEALLDGALAADPSVSTAIVVARNGTVTAARPAGTGLVGSNLGEQAVVREVFDRKAPVMSDLFPLAEGGYAATIEYPVFSPDETVIGMVSVAFLPDRLVGGHAEAAVKGTPYAVMVAQSDGRVLYDADPEEIGKETLNESLCADFPEVLETARSFSGNWSGHAAYSFYDTGFGGVVRKEAYWTSVGLHGTEWRLVVIRPLS
ncbi:MAG: cache domain-containing protein [Methanofollis sp.]|uniref:cache domain-containing protein n=1 Tax=Methanofollis sp. TaxID=2052835 RepID=UPI00262FFD9C|nr:cache domain-containing protein [Methanofollis sp.]MDD4254429.1 cache domain-containing protein [Methanofollis sp.]